MHQRRGAASVEVDRIRRAERQQQPGELGKVETGVDAGAKVKPGKTYRYKSVAVNAKGQQGAASKAATVKVKKAPEGARKKP